MAKTVVKIPNFISGVSQQIPALRFPAQQEEQINGLPSIKNGFGKRYGSEHVAKLPTSLSNTNLWHFIDRGDRIHIAPFSTDFDNSFGDTQETNQYAVGFGNKNIAAANLLGREEDIVFVGDSIDYLATADPKLDLDFVSIQDFTFVLNKSIRTTMTAELDSLRPFECLLFVAKSRINTTFNVLIDGVSVATITTDASVAKATVNIAIEVETALIASLSASNFFIVRVGSVIYIASLTGIDFSVQTEDGDGGDAFQVFKGSTPKFSGLPKSGIDGFRIKIENDSDFDLDNFWVEFKADNLFDTGAWVESREDGLQNIIDKKTMPHQLINNTTDIWEKSFGSVFGIQTFSLTAVDWDERLVGSVLTSPIPSFIGSTIDDIFFMKNRLGINSGEATLQSEDSNFSNFWTTTLQTLLDTDPIDIGTSHNKSSRFRHAVPSQGKLLLFSKDTLFIYGSGDNVLSPKTISINPASEVSINENVKPFVSLSSVFFAVNKKKGTTIKEVTVEDDLDTIIPQDITSHVPNYIPEDLQSIGGSNVDNLLFFISNVELSSVFLYKFLIEGKKKILSAWTKWTFAGSGLEIGGSHAIGDNYYMICNYTDGKYLQKMNLSIDYNNKDLGHPLMLDRLVSVRGSYSSVTNLTTWALPYADSDELKLILSTKFTVPGRELKQSLVLRPTTSTITYPGDFTAGLVHIGKRFETSTEMTQPLLKSTDQGVPVVDHTPVFTVHSFEVDFFESAGFNVDVTYKDGTVRTKKFSGLLTQNTDFTVGQYNFNSDTFAVPIKTRGGRRVRVKVYDNGYVPFNIYSGRWNMNITRGKGRY